MKKQFLLFIGFLLPISMFLAACGNDVDSTAKDDAKLTVYTTVYPLQFFTEEIGGDAVHVETIYPPGADEHTFDPSQKDMMALADSDLFFYVGLGLEGFVEKAKESLSKEDVAMVATGDSIITTEAFAQQPTDPEHSEEEIAHGDHEDHEEETEHDDHNHGDIDPHVWIDPVYAKEMAYSIKNALISEMPEKEAEFTKNYEALVKKLDALNQKFTDLVSNAKNKEIIVSHAAYGYWESRYGLEQISVSGLSTSSEPSQKDLETIIDKAKELDLNYIYFEQNVSSKITEIIQNEIGAEALVLHNLSTRTDEDIENNRDYFAIMEDNLTALEKGLR
ncbi:metal ABC transporter solute-binding protein, Zn/Mn family [Niallia sp. Krafla_26]|uniref:metal ABC transporter solute-binding protein, Zn/Mn family n=1 Tax=Niallia sp. Krafla_26 TaxID=3064703 RepID=UPI003D165EE3